MDVRRNDTVGEDVLTTVSLYLAKLIHETFSTAHYGHWSKHGTNVQSRRRKTAVKR